MMVVGTCQVQSGVMELTAEGNHKVTPRVLRPSRQGHVPDHMPALHPTYSRAHSSTFGLSPREHIALTLKALGLGSQPRNTHYIPPKVNESGRNNDVTVSLKKSPTEVEYTMHNLDFFPYLIK